MARLTTCGALAIFLCVLGSGEAVSLADLIKHRVEGIYAVPKPAQGPDGKTVMVGGVQMPMLTLPGLPQLPVTPQQPGASTAVLSVCPDVSVCAPSGQCLLSGGVAIGRCAMGFMVCCTRREEIPQTCTATNSLLAIKDRVSIIQHSAAAKSCRYEVYKHADNICQLKVEIETFDLADPIGGADCSDVSRLTVSESVTVPNNFPLCGKHDDTTLYLAYGRSSRLSLDFRTRLGDSYRIRLTQLGCLDSADRIPDQCLMNQESAYGLVKSFGFPHYMINGQKYTVCVNSKAVSDMGNIKWEECDREEAQSDSHYNFLLSEYFVDLPQNKSLDGQASRPNETPAPGGQEERETNSTVFLSAEGTSCLRTSHIEIHGDGKRCGAKFLTSASNAVTSDSRPYMLSVDFRKDTAQNLPDFAYYHIRGLVRNQTTPGVGENIPLNDCNYGPKGSLSVPPTQGFESCQLATSNMGGQGSGLVLFDLCICAKKLGPALNERPAVRQDGIKRRGFCLKYSVY